MTEEEAMKMYQESHPDAMENDVFILSWITGGDQEDIYARSANFTTPVFRDPEISEMVRELEHGPPVPPPSNAQDDHTVHRNNLDWITESVDNPDGIPPKMMSRVLKAGDLARQDAWRPKKRY
jgi:hypothetical protein